MNKTRINLIFCILGIILYSCKSTDEKENQTISFDYLPPHNISEGSFTLQATTSSGLPVAFISSDPSTVSILDYVATLHKPGIVEITAVQKGNFQYYQAARVTRSLTINEDNNLIKKYQEITFVLKDTVWKVSQGALTLKATATSGLPVTFTSSNIAYASIKGNLLEVESAAIIGNNEGVIVVVTASQAGNYEYNAAPTVSYTLRVIHDVH